VALRAGSALVLIGLIALMVFVVTFSIDQADVRVLVLGAGLSALGLVLRRRAARAERQASQRFRTLRRLLGRADEPPEPD
jgi:hypothetical protein